MSRIESLEISDCVANYLYLKHNMAEAPAFVGIKGIGLDLFPRKHSASSIQKKYTKRNH